ncbi:MAG: TatD family hydrolase [Christensenellales bacterium]
MAGEKERLFDTHAHLTHPKFDGDRQEVIAAMAQAGVDLCMTVGDDVQSSKECIALAEKHKGLYAVCGIHPHEAKDMRPGDIDVLKKMMEHPKVRAWGEIGLDYYYDFSDRSAQRECFEAQLDAAFDIGKPCVLHVRDSHGDTFALLKSRADKNGLPKTLLHCYSGSAEMAREYVKLGCSISFTGVITFKNASKILEAVKAVPKDRLMIETDCPYLAPVPYRGKRNEPAFVAKVAQAVADIRGESYEDVCAYTHENGKRFFGIE